MAAFHTRRRVEFADTDMEGMVHFARFFVFMETAEHELLQAAGGEVHAEVEGEDGPVVVVWPRAAATCDYLAPLRFGDTVDLEVRVERRGGSSVTYAHTLRRGDTTVARGRVTAVCCRRGPDGELAAHPIPEELAAVLDGYR